VEDGRRGKRKKVSASFSGVRKGNYRRQRNWRWRRGKKGDRTIRRLIGAQEKKGPATQYSLLKEGGDDISVRRGLGGKEFFAIAAGSQKSRSCWPEERGGKEEGTGEVLHLSRPGRGEAPICAEGGIKTRVWAIQTTFAFYGLGGKKEEGTDVCLCARRSKD